MENRLRNLSVLVEEYQVHILDLVKFSWISSTKENTESVLTRIFVSIFRGLKDRKNPLPLYMSIYVKAIKTILKAKTLPQRSVPSVKEIDSDVNIEEFDPANFKNINILEAFKSITPKDRLILCLMIRHRIPIEEIATLFSTTSGSILSRAYKSKIDLAKYIIKTAEPDAKKVILKESRECFFTKNSEPGFRNNLISKEDNNKISRHLAKCSQCKNFYSWNQIINKLIEDVEKPQLDNQINKHIFYHLEKHAFIRVLFYNLSHNWMVKIPTISAGLALIIILITSYYPVAQNKKTQAIKHQNAVILQPQVQPVEKKLTYKITAESFKRKTVVGKLLTILTSLNAKKVREDQELGTFDGKVNYFHFLINKKDLTAFLESIQPIEIFQVEEQEETTSLDKDSVRVELWVKKKNAK